jgi:hypothetical protein
MTQQLPEGFVLDTPDQQAQSSLPPDFVIEAPAQVREDTPPEVVNEKGFFASISDYISGSSATTPSIEQLPTIMDGGFLEGESLATAAKIAVATMLTNDPNEIANIIQKQMPSVKVVYNKDGKGEIYPILVNKNGMTAIIDKPGIDLMNIAQFTGQAAAFMAGGPGKNILTSIALDATREAVIQGYQSSVGGEFDTGDVLVSGGIGGLSKGVEDVAGAAYRSIKGSPTPEVSGVLAASEQWGVPVSTTDIYNPQTWLGRGVQWSGETVPIVGTGGMRYMQQDARRSATEQFQSLHRGGTYEDLINDMAKRSAEMKKVAGDIYNKIDPYLEQQSVDIGMNLNSGNQALEGAISVMTNPKQKWSDSAINMLDDIQAVVSSGQSYKDLKHNLGAWEADLAKVDSGLRPKEIAEIRKVIGGFRKDRNEFAAANLSKKDYASYEEANRLYGESANNLKRTKLKNIFEKGDVTPEIARQMLFSNKASEVELLFDNLTPEGLAIARSVIVTDIMDSMSKRSSGDVLNPDVFISELRKKLPAVEKAWGGREAELEGFIKLMDVTRRAQAAATGAGSQTAERQIVGDAAKVVAAGGGIAAGVPWEVIGAYASIGGMARVFESPAVRNILVKMNGMEAGSTGAQVLAGQFNSILRASAQANPEKGKGEVAEVAQEVSNEFRPRTAPVVNSRFPGGAQ